MTKNIYITCKKKKITLISARNHQTSKNSQGLCSLLFMLLTIILQDTARVGKVVDDQFQTGHQMSAFFPTVYSVSAKNK